MLLLFWYVVLWATLGACDFADDTPVSAIESPPTKKGIEESGEVSNQARIAKAKKEIEQEEKRVRGIHKLRSLERLRSEITRRITKYQVEIEESRKLELEEQIREKQKIEEIAKQKRTLRLAMIKGRKDLRLIVILEDIQTKPVEIRYPETEKIFPALTQDFVMFAKCSEIPISQTEFFLDPGDESRVVEWLIGAATDCGVKMCLGIDDLKFVLKQATKSSHACEYIWANQLIIEQIATRSEVVSFWLSQAKKCFEKRISEPKNKRKGSGRL